MIEVKFRAWDGEKMISPDYISRTGSAHWKENSIPCCTDKVMQFTGLNDFRLRQIFEGDIILWKVNDVERIAPVYYDELQACFWMGKDVKTGHLVLNDWQRGYYEVIGNIYQNPDLLAQ